MKLIAIATIFAVSAVFSSGYEIVSEQVVNGEDAAIQDFPYLAKVWNLNWPACGGSIITSRSVLTVSFNQFYIFNHEISLKKLPRPVTVFYYEFPDPVPFPSSLVLRTDLVRVDNATQL